jgi:predicted regulator of Ras-like GTPase activity (Roadblock/LC7/MglB family)
MVGTEVASLTIGLTLLAEGWPDPVRKEILQMGLVDSKLAIPVDMLERTLRQGRVAFPWKVVRTWLKPAVPPATSSQDGTILDLPLKVVAPLFLARQKEQRKAQQQKVEIDENIPNLFFGFPQPEPVTPGAAPVPKAADTNIYVWEDGSESVRDSGDSARRPVVPSVGTQFVSKYATPNEIVSRAAAIDGVAGALIALPDGLLVASRLPQDLNADTLAAFLPQIFGKMSQCTKELRMGELNNLNFTVGNVPWKIFRVNAIFFAAFGRSGEPLPTAQLAALAAELDHKPK